MFALLTTNKVVNTRGHRPINLPAGHGSTSPSLVLPPMPAGAGPRPQSRVVDMVAFYAQFMTPEESPLIPRRQTEVISAYSLPQHTDQSTEGSLRCYDLHRHAKDLGIVTHDGVCLHELKISPQLHSIRPSKSAGKGSKRSSSPIIHSQQVLERCSDCSSPRRYLTSSRKSSLSSDSSGESPGSASKDSSDNISTDVDSLTEEAKKQMENTLRQSKTLS